MLRVVVGLVKMDVVLVWISMVDLEVGGRT